MGLLAPQPPGLTRGLDRSLLDCCHGPLELVRVATADGDETGASKNAVPGGQVGFLLEARDANADSDVSVSLRRTVGATTVLRTKEAVLSAHDEAQEVLRRVMFGADAFKTHEAPDEFSELRLVQLMAEAKAPSWAPPGTLESALDLLNERSRSTWAGRGSRINPRRRLRFASGTSGRALMLTVPPAELLILRLLSATKGSHEYSVDAGGAVFTTGVNGWSRDAERFYVAGLSPLIDDIGQRVWELTESNSRRGGRVYESQGQVFHAKGGGVFAIIRTE